MQAGNSGFVIGAFLSLFFSAFLISYFLISICGIGTVSHEVPLIGTQFNSEQDFTTNEVNQTLIKYNTGSDYSFVSGIGYVLQGGVTYLGSASHLYISGISDSENIISNTYYINNSATNLAGLHGDYGITIRDTGSGSQIDILIQGNGFSLPNYVTAPIVGKLYVGEKQLISYPNANQVVSPVITTQFNKAEKILSITFNGDTYNFDSGNIPDDDNVYGLFGRYYAGVFSEQQGFTLMKFDSGNGLSNLDTSFIGLMTNIVTTMFTLIVWNVDPKYLPWELNILLLKTQDLILFISVVIAARG